MYFVSGKRVILLSIFLFVYNLNAMHDAKNPNARLVLRQRSFKKLHKPNTKPVSRQEFLNNLDSAIRAMDRAAECLLLYAQQAAEEQAVTHEKDKIASVISRVKAKTSELFNNSREEIGKLRPNIAASLKKKEKAVWREFFFTKFKTMDAYVEACRKFRNNLQDALNEYYIEIENSLRL